MREIEFRGKYDLNSEFTYGDLIHGVGAKSNKMYILPNVINLAKIKNCHPLDGVSVLTETIGQYTGLKDKNGTKIFEGDIVKSPYTPLNSEPDIIEYFKIGVVVYPYYLMLKLDCSNILDEERKLMHHRNKREVFCLNGQYDYISKGDLFSKRIEVIGNIHDNPELLK